MKTLIRTTNIKVNRWLDRPQTVDGGPFVYDKADDAMLLYIEKPGDRIITHYVDDIVSLLYRQSDKELVGFRISSFYKEFFPSIVRGQMGVWRLSDADSLLFGRYDIELYGVPVGELYSIRANVIDSFAISLPAMAIGDQALIELALIPN
jgi:hypothetical protein